MQDAKEEVRARIEIEDVIGEYVQLKRAGRNFKGLSPFTGERTPSFYVSPDKHIWHDFSSNKGGDIFAFIMEVEGMDFRGALEHLARKAGVDLSQYESKGNQDIARRKKRLQQANDLAATYYQHSLLKNQHALEYVFQTRGFSKAIVQDFRLGYAPDNGDALIQFLSKKGFSSKELSDAGLTNRYGSDLFRGRMTVPLMDASGQVIGFTGRIITDEPNAPKYLNTPQTLIYDKSRHVFGLSQAKEAIRTGGYAVIVEGNLDVVSSHQADVRPVVATAGTAMTSYHLRALKRLTSDIRLAFDVDKAGLAATERAIPLASEAGVELTIITLSDDAKDPDELIRRDPKLWKSVIDSAQPAVDWVLERYKAQHDLTTATGKGNFTTAGLQVIRGLADPVERDHYVQQMAATAGVSVDALTQKLSRPIDDEPRYREVKSIQSDVYKNPDKNQDALLAVALRDIYVQDIFKSLTPHIFTSSTRQAVATYIGAHAGTPIETIPDELQEHAAYVTMLLLNQDVESLDWNQESRMTTAGTVLRVLQDNYQKHQTKEDLLRLLGEAHQRGDEPAASDYLRQINELIKGEKRA